MVNTINSHPLRLAIVGGGPAGLCLASTLLREAPDSFDLTILERGAADREQGSGWDVDSAAQAAIARAVGPELVAAIQREGSDIMRCFKSNKGNKVEQIIGTPNTMKRCGLALPWTNKETNRTLLVDGLLAPLREAGVDVRFGVRVFGAQKLEDGVRLTGVDGEVLGDFDAAIDASGLAASLRRSRFAPTADARYTGVTVVQGVVDSPEESCDPELVRRLGEGTCVACGPTPDGRGMRTMWLQRFGADAEDKRATFSLNIAAERPSDISDALGFRGVSTKVADVENTRAYLAAQLSAEGWGEEYRSAAEAISSGRVLPIFMHPTATETEALPEDGLPVLCIGDALHALPPWSGTSGNFALQDASDCATALIAAAGRGDRGDALVRVLRGLERDFLERADEPRERVLSVARAMTGVWATEKNFEDFHFHEMVTGGADNAEAKGIGYTLQFFSWVLKAEGRSLAKASVAA